MAKFNTPLVVGLTFVATLGGLLFGWDTAVISGAVSSIDAYFIDPLGLSETARTSLSGWTISSALVGCIIGATVAGWISTALGRKACTTQGMPSGRRRCHRWVTFRDVRGYRGVGVSSSGSLSDSP